MRYPLRLNMLAPQKRQHMRRMILYIFGKNVLEIILVVVALAASILLIGRWFLQDYFNELTSQLVSISNEKSAYNERIQQVNAKLTDLAFVQKKYQPWSPQIGELFQSVPSGIVLERAELDRPLKLYAISGTAEDRSALLTFQKNLIALPFVAQVDLPLSQLTEKEHIPFTLSATLK